MRNAVLAALAAVLTSCVQIDYGAHPEGDFTGSRVVFWVDGGRDNPSGDGVFVYVPMPGDELTFRRKARNATISVIRPEPIYTDGGSTPRVAQIFKGFNSLGYAPAYLVHDWLLDRWVRSTTDCLRRVRRVIQKP